jgi:hypothetical protein
MESCRAAITLSGCPPFALLQHPGLVALADQRSTMHAGVLRVARPARGPAQIRKLERLALMAVRTRHEIPPLVARLAPRGSALAVGLVLA